ncbi:MAG: LysR substrate-binding domain-containing protein, partial [Bacteroidota bacterium]
PLIFREEGSATRSSMERFIQRQKIVAQKNLTLTSNEAVKQAVIAGLGYSIMPVIGLRNELHSGQVHIVPMDGLPLTTNWNLIWLKNKRASPATEAYLAYLKEEKSRIIEAHFAWYNQFQETMPDA